MSYPPYCQKCYKEDRFCRCIHCLDCGHRLCICRPDTRGKRRVEEHDDPGFLTKRAPAFPLSDYKEQYKLIKKFLSPTFTPVRQDYTELSQKSKPLIEALLSISNVSIGGADLGRNEHAQRLTLFISTMPENFTEYNFTSRFATLSSEKTKIGYGTQMLFTLCSVLTITSFIEEVELEPEKPLVRLVIKKVEQLIEKGLFNAVIKQIKSENAKHKIYKIIDLFNSFSHMHKYFTSEIFVIIKSSLNEIIRDYDIFKLLNSLEEDPLNLLSDFKEVDKNIKKYFIAIYNLELEFDINRIIFLGTYLEKLSARSLSNMLWGIAKEDQWLTASSNLKEFVFKIVMNVLKTNYDHEDIAKTLLVLSKMGCLFDDIVKFKLDDRLLSAIQVIFEGGNSTQLSFENIMSSLNRLNFSWNLITEKGLQRLFFDMIQKNIALATPMWISKVFFSLAYMGCTWKIFCSNNIHTLYFEKIREKITLFNSENIPTLLRAFAKMNVSSTLVNKELGISFFQKASEGITDFKPLDLQLFLISCATIGYSWTELTSYIPEGVLMRHFSLNQHEYTIDQVIRVLWSITVMSNILQLTIDHTFLIQVNAQFSQLWATADVTKISEDSKQRLDLIKMICPSLIGLTIVDRVILPHKSSHSENSVFEKLNNFLKSVDFREQHFSIKKSEKLGFSYLITDIVIEKEKMIVGVLEYDGLSHFYSDNNQVNTGTKIRNYLLSRHTGCQNFQCVYIIPYYSWGKIHADENSQEHTFKLFLENLKNPKPKILSMVGSSTQFKILSVVREKSNLRIEWSDSYEAHNRFIGDALPE